MKFNKLILCLLLTGCSTTVYKPYCPPLFTYTKEFNIQLADELLTAGPNTKRTIADYIALRDAIRECNK